VTLSLVLVQQDRVLNVEVRFIILKVDVLGQKECTYNVILNLADEGEVW
jgi:hypothetical protein